MSKDKINCNGCKYQEKCAGTIFGVLGFGHNIVATDDKKERSYCYNWKEFENLTSKGGEYKWMPYNIVNH